MFMTTNSINIVLPIPNIKLADSAMFYQVTKRYRVAVIPSTDQCHLLIELKHLNQ